jgi:hypothetical protein
MTHISPQSKSLTKGHLTEGHAMPFKRTAKGFPWLYGGFVSGLVGSIVVASEAAWARPLLNDTSHFLVAQQVVDGLPPPPPASGQNLTTGSQAQQYLVVVNGDDQMLLSQVQQIQPSASVQEYNGQRFIQAGLFNDVTAAQQQVSTLATSGINAQLVAVTGSASLVSQAPTPTYDNGTGTLPPPEMFPTTPVPSTPGEVEFSSPSSPDSSLPPGNVNEDRGSSDGSAYYVIIPGGGKNLDAIVNQISRLTAGMGIDNMVQPGTSKGSHVRVGPFNSRGAASRWSRYFRDFGMDARVGFGR